MPYTNKKIFYNCFKEIITKMLYLIDDRAINVIDFCFHILTKRIRVSAVHTHAPVTHTYTYTHAHTRIIYIQ